MPRLVLYADERALVMEFPDPTGEEFEYPDFYLVKLPSEKVAKVSKFVAGLDAAGPRTVWAAEGSDPVRYAIFTSSAQKNPVLKVYGAIESGPIGNPRERSQVPPDLLSGLDLMLAQPPTDRRPLQPTEVQILLLPSVGAPKPSQGGALPDGVPEPHQREGEACLPGPIMETSSPGSEYPRLRKWWKQLGHDRTVSFKGALYRARLRPVFPGRSLWMPSDQC